MDQSPRLCDVVGDVTRGVPFRKIDRPPGLYGGYLALIPCVALAVGMLVAPYLSGPGLRMCSL